MNEVPQNCCKVNLSLFTYYFATFGHTLHLNDGLIFVTKVAGDMSLCTFRRSMFQCRRFQTICRRFVDDFELKKTVLEREWFAK